MPRLINIAYQIIHFTLGFMAIKLGLELPVTLVFIAYEYGDHIAKLKAIEIETNGLGESRAFQRSVLAAGLYALKKELRRDLGSFILGLMLAQILS